MKKDKLKIVFVCSENISRSLIGEYCFKLYLRQNKIEGYDVSSAGTTHTESDISGRKMPHFEELKKLGIDPTNHKRTALAQEIVDKADVIVAMAEHHQRWIKEKFGVYTPMFSEIIDGTKTSIHIPLPEDKECEKVLRSLVYDIYTKIPIFLKNIEKFTNAHKRMDCPKLVKSRPATNKEK